MVHVIMKKGIDMTHEQTFTLTTEEVGEAVKQYLNRKDHLIDDDAKIEVHGVVKAEGEIVGVQKFVVTNP